MTGKDLLIDWLNDAYGMEKSLIQVLEHQSKHSADYPQVQAKIEQHLAETRNHAQMVKECVESLGGHTSALKKGLASLMGQMHGASTAPAKDDLVKDALSDYAAENFEVASYTALIQAAQELNETQVVTVCQQILQEDQAMANWLHQNLPTLVSQSLQELTTA